MDHPESEDDAGLGVNLNHATVEDVSAPGNGIGEGVATKLIQMRDESGQFTSWDDVLQRAKRERIGFGAGKVAKLQERGWEVTPTTPGFLHALDTLPPHALRQRNLLEPTIEQIQAVREARGGKPLRSLRMARAMLRVAAWRDALARLMGVTEQRLLLPPVTPPAAIAAQQDEAAAAANNLVGEDGDARGAGGEGGGASGEGVPEAADGPAEVLGAEVEDDEDSMNNALEAELAIEVHENECDGGAAAGAAEEDQEAEVGAAALPRPRWWEQEGIPEGAPFPPEFREEPARGTGRWRYLYDRIDVDEHGVLTYNGAALSDEAAEELRRRWDRGYPVVPGANAHGNGRETLKDRAATTSRQHREDCWRDLLAIDATRKIPPAWRKKFRSDAYGNVVSINANAKNSVCGFQADHIFPWSRGGLTHKDNLMALHWRANILKTNHILNANVRTHPGGQRLVDRLQVGLTVEQLQALIGLEAGLGMPARQRFRNELERLLCDPYPITWPLSLQGLVDGRYSGSVIFEGLRDMHEAMRTDLFGLIGVGAAGGAAAGAGEDEE